LIPDRNETHARKWRSESGVTVKMEIGGCVDMQQKQEFSRPRSTQVKANHLIIDHPTVAVSQPFLPVQRR
jgi:hypothetical protein